MPTAGKHLRYAGFWPRAAAFVLDHLIICLPLLILRGILALRAVQGWMKPGAAVFFLFTWTDIILWAATVAYFTVLTYFSGCTLGKRAMGLRVVDLEGERPSFILVLCRETFGRYLSGLILCVGYLLAIDKENGALHDRICDTRVVYADSLQSAAPLSPASAGTARSALSGAVRTVSDPVGEWYASYRV